jgi:uncharacterized protein (DUF2141 family)
MSLFNYNLSVTGDCSNVGVGAILVVPTGGTPPYTVEWTTPSLGEDQAVLESFRGGLYPNTYVIRVNDSTLPTNQEFFINIPVSDGICASIVQVNDTTCSLLNGSVTATSTSDYSSTNYYLFDSGNSFITSAITTTSTAVFENLSAGTYSIMALDLGGCTGVTPTFIIDDSGPFDFGLYVVPNSSCGGTPIGKILVTGLTGQAPYSYLWSNGQTGSTITGLTAGQYSVAITDASGCQQIRNGVLTNISSLGFGAFSANTPSCLQANGQITLTITGGTAPYYYSASTGDFAVSYSQEYTISNLSSGQYNFLVTDAAFCQINVGTTLATPQGISSVSVIGTNSTCSSNNGSITASVDGGTLPYTYTLILPDASTQTITNSQTSYVWRNLASGTYSVVIQDSSTPTACYSLTEIIIINENRFTISLSQSGTTCGQNNGKILVTKSVGGASPYDFILDGGVQSVIDTTSSAATFSNLTSGQHTISVVDATGCTQIQTIFVEQSEQLDFSLYTTSCGSGSDGRITAFISSGTPPFSFNWSSNVSNNPQQIQISGLSAGTYTCTIIDDDGCSLSRTTNITCAKSYASYQSYVMGSEIFRIQSPTKLGMLQMLNEGFADLTSGNTTCDLVTAEFIAIVKVQPLGTIIQDQFYTGTTLTQVPSDSLWFDTIKDLLLSVSGVGNVIVDQLNNQITIQTQPGNTTLNNQEIIVELKIIYDIMCLT